MPFKLLRAGIAGGRKLAPPSIIHQAQHQDSSESPHIITILCFNGLICIGHYPVIFVLDSGNAISVVRLEAITSEFHHKITKETTSAPVGATGSLLDVVGQIKTPVSIGAFMTEQVFTVVSK